MAKKQLEENPPLDLAPAKLFLDDLEELARLFTNALEREEILDEGHLPLRVVYKVDIWECDALGDLKEFGKTKRKDEFFLEIRDAQDLSITGIYKPRRIYCGLAVLASLPPVPGLCTDSYTRSFNRGSYRGT